MISMWHKDKLNRFVQKAKRGESLPFFDNAAWVVIGFQTQRSLDLVEVEADRVLEPAPPSGSPGRSAIHTGKFSLCKRMHCVHADVLPVAEIDSFGGGCCREMVVRVRQRVFDVVRGS